VRQSTKLVVNSGTMLARTIGNVVLALFTTRLVVNELGQVDFGLFSLVGVTVGLSAVLSDALQAAGQRHLSH
jgi:O-antigen/teichoic acid export membrane protein